MEAIPDVYRVYTVYKVIILIAYGLHDMNVQ